MVDSPNSSRKILVCQNRTCRRQGAAAVLKAFQSPLAKDITVIGSSCLGECGNGPMVLVMPEKTWYSRVHPQEVPAVVQRHLKEGHPVKAMLYLKYHRI